MVVQSTSETMISNRGHLALFGDILVIIAWPGCRGRRGWLLLAANE